MRERLIRNLDLMLAAYEPGAKSKHWEMFFTPKMQSMLRSDEIQRFRSNTLKADLEDKAGWFKTADAYERLSRVVGADWIDRYSETEIGHPVTHKISGRQINFHELVLCEYLWKISYVEMGDTNIIVEIGGGYGGLAHKLKKRIPKASYVSLDLPEALTLQTYYLFQLNPSAKFYLFDDFTNGKPIEPEDYDFTLLPGWLSQHVKTASLLINTRSMMEMNRGVIAGYFNLIHQLLKPGDVFYNVNRYSKDTVGEAIRFKDYPYDDRWAVEFSNPSFFQPHVHELMTRRTDRPGNIAHTLRTLPDTDPTRTRKSVGLIRKLRLLPMGIR